MILLKFICFVYLWSFVFTGCAGTQYTKQNSIYMVFKTPSFKYADLGFMYANDEEIKVEIYSNGQALMALELQKEKICMSWLECLDKKSFNKRVLNEAYPKDILRHIFKAEEIFSGLNRTQTSNGFTQNISIANKYHINYSVLNKQIIFRDTMNHIMIKIQRLGS